MWAEKSPKAYNTTTDYELDPAQVASRGHHPFSVKSLAARGYRGGANVVTTLTELWDDVTHGIAEWNPVTTNTRHKWGS